MAGIKVALARMFAKVSVLAARWGSWLTPPQPRSEQYGKRLTRWKQLWFIADVPLFIDESSVKRLFDAVVRPEFEATSRRYSATEMLSAESSAELALGGEVGVAPFLKGSTSFKGAQKEGRSRTTGLEVDEEVNHSAEYLLEKIVQLYARDYPHRLFWTTGNLSLLEDMLAEKIGWAGTAGRLRESDPRPLIVLDLPEKSQLIPMAGESTDGKVKLLYEEFLDKCKDGASVPKYPDDPGSRNRSQSYWKALDKVFDSRIAMKVVENCTSEGVRLEWIDYRLMATSAVDEIIALHLHLQPKGLYNTGTFAYQTIRRCFKHGLRIVGTLKQGEDINVLAMYEN